MIRIIADDKIPFLRGALEPFADVKYLHGSSIGAEDVKTADGLIIRTRTKCGASLLQGSSVRFIATATIGFDHIDTGYCDRQDIRWVSAPGCNSGSVQQYIASVLATIAVRHDFILRGKTLGIIGVGNAGKKVETLARILGMEVLLNDPPRSRAEGTRKFVEIDRLLESSDIITLHVPLNRTGPDKTLDLINENTIGRMRPGAILINTSRGEVVETNALAHALDSGKISGAVLDVWKNEPRPDPALIGRIRIATPHIAGYSTDGKSNGTMQVVRLAGLFFGFPLTDWTPEGLPLAGEPVIRLDGRGLTADQAAYAAILHTYDVTKDDTAFRSDPEEFETLRGTYPVRREFPTYTVAISHPPQGSVSMLEAMGFKVK